MRKVTNIVRDLDWVDLITTTCPTTIDIIQVLLDARFPSVHHMTVTVWVAHQEIHANKNITGFPSVWLCGSIYGYGCYKKGNNNYTSPVARPNKASLCFQQWYIHAKRRINCSINNRCWCAMVATAHLRKLAAARFCAAYRLLCTTEFRQILTSTMR